MQLNKCLRFIILQKEQTSVKNQINEEMHRSMFNEFMTSKVKKIAFLSVKRSCLILKSKFYSLETNALSLQVEELSSCLGAVGRRISRYLPVDSLYILDHCYS